MDGRFVSLPQDLSGPTGAGALKFLDLFCRMARPQSVLQRLQSLHSKRWRSMPATQFCFRVSVLLSLLFAAMPARAQTAQPISISINSTSRFQTIEGFGTALSSQTPVWVPQLLTMYTQDLGATIMRMPLDPNILPNQVTLGPDLQSNI